MAMESRGFNPQAQRGLALTIPLGWIDLFFVSLPLLATL
jgi:energy-coupling factor transporter transmembrane protein EcfT